ncbi:hypothetical protein ARSEF4850_009727, partial [Beauveria asiatica]
MSNGFEPPHNIILLVHMDYGKHQLLIRGKLAGGPFANFQEK